MPSVTPSKVQINLAFPLESGAEKHVLRNHEETSQKIVIKLEVKAVHDRARAGMQEDLILISITTT